MDKINSKKKNNIDTNLLECTYIKDNTNKQHHDKLYEIKIT